MNRAGRERRPGGVRLGGRAADSLAFARSACRADSLAVQVCFRPFRLPRRFVGCPGLHSLVPSAAPIRWLSRSAFARRRPILLPRSACRPSSFRRRCPSPSFSPPDASRGDGRPVSDFWQRLLFSLAEGVDRAHSVVRGDLARKAWIGHAVSSAGTWRGRSEASERQVRPDDRRTMKKQERKKCK